MVTSRPCRGTDEYAQRGCARFGKTLEFLELAHTACRSNSTSRRWRNGRRRDANEGI
jgi:hypothetical protein